MNPNLENGVGFIGIHPLKDRGPNDLLGQNQTLETSLAPAEGHKEDEDTK